MGRTRWDVDQELLDLGLWEGELFTDFLGAKFPPSLALKLRSEAQRRGVSVSVLIRDIVAKFWNTLDVTPLPMVNYNHTSDNACYV